MRYSKYSVYKTLLAVLLVAVVACSVSSDSDSANCLCLPDGKVENAKPGQGPMVIMGDSLASGQGASNKSAHTPQACLENYFNQSAQSFAVGGYTSENVLKSLDLALAWKPKIVFISSGGNDAVQNVYRPGAYPESKSIEEMNKIFTELLSQGALVVYLGLKPPFQGNERLAKIWTMARQMGVIVVDGMNGHWGNKDLMADDIHPNDKGYKIMCERIIEITKGFYP